MGAGRIGSTSMLIPTTKKQYLLALSDEYRTLIARLTRLVFYEQCCQQSPTCASYFAAKVACEESVKRVKQRIATLELYASTAGLT